MNSKTIESKEYNIIVIDDDINDIQNRIFNNIKQYKSPLNQQLFNFHFSDNPWEVIENLTFSKIKIDAVLLDINFENLNEEKLKGFKDFNKTKLGIYILKIIKRIDPTIPVLMLTVITDPLIALFTGRYQADDYFTKIQIEKDGINTLCQKIYTNLKKCKENAIYDIEHLEIAEKYAKNYDKDEQEKIATVVYLHFENELILNEIKNLLDNNKERNINILDLGCGTGRIETLLDARLNQDQKKSINVVAVDFSGEMLNALRQKEISLPNLQIIRSPAEVICSYDTELKEESFDFIITGFGFLSYVNYKAVLMPHKGHFAGLSALAKPGGKLLFSVYNEESLIYDRIAKDKGEDLPMAAWVDLKEGVLLIPGHKVVAMAFSRNYLERIIHQSGLKIAKDQIITFPTFHLSLNNSECNDESGFILGGDPLFSTGRFNKALYNNDIAHSLLLKDKGHYIVTIAYRPEK